MLSYLLALTTNTEIKARHVHFASLQKIIDVHDCISRLNFRAFVLSCPAIGLQQPHCHYAIDDRFYSIFIFQEIIIWPVILMDKHC